MNIRDGFKKEEKSDDVDRFFHHTEIPIDPEKKRSALDIVQSAIKKKRSAYRPSFCEIIFIQLQYISSGYWFGQGFMVLFLSFFFWKMGKEQALTPQYLSYFSMAAAFMGVIGITEVARHFSFHMAELEQTCYLNLQQAWTIKMLLFGGMDIFLLSFLTEGISRRIGYEFFRVSIYLLVPFVLSNICYLLIFSAGRSTRKYLQFGVSVLLALFFSLPAKDPRAYYFNYFAIWVVVLLTGIAILSLQIYLLYRKLGKGEVLCWN